MRRRPGRAGRDPLLRRVEAPRARLLPQLDRPVPGGAVLPGAAASLAGRLRRRACGPSSAYWLERLLHASSSRPAAEVLAAHVPDAFLDHFRAATAGSSSSGGEVRATPEGHAPPSSFLAEQTRGDGGGLLLHRRGGGRGPGRGGAGQREGAAQGRRGTVHPGPAARRGGPARGRQPRHVQERPRPARGPSQSWSRRRPIRAAGESPSPASREAPPSTISRPSGSASPRRWPPASGAASARPPRLARGAAGR